MFRFSPRYVIVFAIATSPFVTVAGCRQQDTASTQSSNRAPAHTVEQALQRGIDYLFVQQSDDGGWHSPAYGAMQPGAPVTANVLYGMAHVPARFTQPYRDRLTLACQFLSQGIDTHGYVTNPDGSPNYPNYASAMLLVADRRLQLDLSPAHRQRLVAFLVAAQLDTKHGYAPEDPDYGGWDLMGWDLGPRVSAGTNISVSRVVIEALVEERDQPGVPECLQRAENWLRRCQNLADNAQAENLSARDGGFHFHPEADHHGNKAGWLDDARTTAASYGTATADGLLALVLLEIPLDDARIQAALAWLQKHPAVMRVPGFETTSPTGGWEQGLLFYYYATVTATWRALEARSDEAPVDGLPVPFNETLPEDDPRQPIAVQMAGKIVQAQQRDGSWENKSNRMREDDPMIATPFALAALGNLMAK